MKLRSALVLAVLAQLGFAAKAIFIKLAYAREPGLEATTMLTLRMLYALPFFLLMAFWASRREDSLNERIPMTPRDRWRVLFLGFIGYYLASFFDFWGLEFISAALERLILFLNPTFVVLIGVLFLGQRLSARTVGALALSYFGLVLAFWHDLKLTADTGALWLGSALVGASALCYAVYLQGSAGITKRLGSTRFTALMMLTSTACIVIHFLVKHPPSKLAVSAPVHALSLAMAFFSTVLPVWAMAEALKHIGASKASIFGSIGPVFTIALGVIFLNESVSALQLLGASLTIVGVALTGAAKPKS